MSEAQWIIVRNGGMSAEGSRRFLFDTAPSLTRRTKYMSCKVYRRLSDGDNQPRSSPLITPIATDSLAVVWLSLSKTTVRCCSSQSSLSLSPASLHVSQIASLVHFPDPTSLIALLSNSWNLRSVR